MPAASTVLLPLCVAIALIGVILAGLAWRRGNKSRVIQAAALVIVPFGLYLTGLLSVLWNFVVSLVHWAVRLVFSPLLWIGFGVLALCVALFVIGSIMARLNRGHSESKPKQVSGRGSGKSTSGKGTPSKAIASRKQSAADVDPEMAEIEALLKSRGIE
jgi:membrane-bound ClpP family serine protease